MDRKTEGERKREREMNNITVLLLSLRLFINVSIKTCNLTYSFILLLSYGPAQDCFCVFLDQLYQLPRTLIHMLLTSDVTKRN